MQCATRPIRVSILCLLTASWATPILFQPAPMRSVARAACIQAKPIHKCCCGCKDGKCCGMACCKNSSPQEQPATPPVRSSGGSEFKPLVLFNGVIEPANSSTGFSEAIHGRGHVPVGQCSPSLQSKHVRIQT